MHFKDFGKIQTANENYKTLLGELSVLAKMKKSFLILGDEGSGRRTLADRKSTRLNSSHIPLSRMPSSA